MEEEMSSHADTIRSAVEERANRILLQNASNTAKALARDSLALLAENQRLREALERIADVPEWWQGEVAREALAGDAE
jgi:hypothetical protein